MKRIIGVTMIWLLGVSFASASFFDAGDRVRIRENIKGDAYLAGDTLSIESPIRRDLIAAGGTLSVDAPVGEDVMLAGVTIDITEPVGDDVRVMGSVVNIEASVDGDVIVLAESVRISDDVVIEGDLIVAGGSIMTDAEVQGNLRVAAETLFLNGSVDGDADIFTHKFDSQGVIQGNTRFVAHQEVMIQEDAEFLGDVSYWSPTEVEFNNKVAGILKYDASLKDWMQREKPSISSRWGFGLLRLIWGASIILVLMILFNKHFKKAATTLNTGKDYGLSLFYGVLGFLVVPALILLLFVTIVGVPLAIAMLSLYMLLLFFSGSIASLLGACIIEHKTDQKLKNITIFGWSVGIYAGLYLLGFLPGVLPFVIWFFVLAVSWGAFIRSVRKA